MREVYSCCNTEPLLQHRCESTAWPRLRHSGASPTYPGGASPVDPMSNCLMRDVGSTVSVRRPSAAAPAFVKPEKILCHVDAPMSGRLGGVRV